MVPFLVLALLAQDDPVATSAPAAPPAAVAPAEITPAGAPSDDYEFVGWCKGVLSGHMALAERVQTVLPMDEVQQKIGAAYLKGYDEALTIGGRSRSAAERDAAKRAEQAARGNWDQAMRADLQLAADTYLAWQLPGRCEHAAKRVAGNAELFRMAPSVEETDAAPIGAGLAAAAPAPVAADGSNPTTVTAEAGVNETPTASTASVDAATEPPSNAAPSELAAIAAPAEAPMNAAPAELSSAERATPAATVEPAAAVAAAPSPTQGEDAKPVEATDPDNKVVRMPKKGRLLPFGRN